MSESRGEATSDGSTASPPPDEVPADAYGKLFSDARQAHLQGILDAWNAPQADHGERKGPFDGVKLSGADVSWLAELSGRGEFGRVPNLHLEGAGLVEAHLEGASLVEAHLEEASLLSAHLEGANLTDAHLEGARLSKVHLEGARLTAAHLEGASLVGAHLEGADLRGAHLEGAILIGAWLDSKTVLSDANLDRETKLGDIHWNGVGSVDLTSARWDKVPTLGDEQGVSRRAPAQQHEAAVRAYRQVAAQLQAQGMSEVADRFLYRAQIRQRATLRRQRKWGAYLFSWLLAALAGYGFRLQRILFTYAIVVLLFAAGYFVSGGLQGQAVLTLPQQGLDAVQVSLNAIHGRVFFTQLGLDTVQSWLATVESILGIVIEGAFVAMLIQRFFGR